MVSPLNGFLAGILLGFDPARAPGWLRPTVPRSTGAVSSSRWSAVASGPPAGPTVTISVAALDLVTARLGADEATRKAALGRIDFDGDPGAIDALCTAFSLSGNSPRARGADGRS
ncbi:putative transcriptional regulatory protein [Mycobacterium ulcerans str. Harvey]|uniref:Transcriptional regulatory protein n=1 Tax=Mycobacterium ulcerans str. Harvey TaxID=1299332 RepID=A0ABP3AMM7_MYCUL|nr:putative transcriptional regulatory protein [Mycobacterium ulcerans str. Harvey]